MRPFFLLGIISLQFVLIILLIHHISVKNDMRKNTMINPIKKETIVSSESGKLKHFYEPKPNTVIKPEVIFPGLEDVSYHINSAGFNQFREYKEEKAKDTYRILTIGDSFTFGANVNTAENYPSQLEEIINTQLFCPNINNFEVLNLGVGGYDIQYTVERLRRNGIKYNPDIIIWVLIPDDFGRLDELFIPLFQKYLTESKQKGEHSKVITNNTYNSEWIKAKNEIIEKLGGYSTVFSMQENYFNELRTFYPGSLLVTLLQTPYDQNTDITKHKNILRDFSQKDKKIFFYDSFPNIYEVSDTALPDSHLNKKGNLILANHLMRYLVNAKILPCSYK